MPAFKDHFSRQAPEYASFRPGYPGGLFEFLVSIAPDKILAWDCATGSGQAAAGLAGHFGHVIATDASAAQIANAAPHPKIEYRVAPAEEPGLEPECCSLITVAQAAHWLDLDRFGAICRQVLKPGGVMAVWGYNLVEIAPDIDAVVRDFYHNVVGEFWPPDRRHVESEYRDLTFPLPEMTAPHFDMSAQWRLGDLTGYVSTWSATRRYIDARGVDPVPALAAELRRCWHPPEEARIARWPLFIKVGRRA